MREKKGWWAIDFNENVLFQVYNTTDGEPSPDELNFDRIRIVNEKGKIGFADGKGKIVVVVVISATLSGCTLTK
jgi:hypothetical protein